MQTLDPANGMTSAQCSWHREKALTPLGNHGGLARNIAILLADSAADLNLEPRRI